MKNDIVREASELFGSLDQQLAAMGGMWPESVVVDAKRFKQVRKWIVDGVLESVVYKAADGSRLVVVND